MASQFGPEAKRRARDRELELRISRLTGFEERRRVIRALLFDEAHLRRRAMVLDSLSASKILFRLEDLERSIESELSELKGRA